MKQEFDEIESLFAYIEDDKARGGNRYPICFVLFDGFEQCNSFVSIGQKRYKWNVIRFDGDGFLSNDETFPSRQFLEEKIRQRIAAATGDSVIMPFSEFARFYNDRDFAALIQTLKLIENGDNYIKKRRIYIPLVGLKGRMSSIENAQESKVFYLKAADKQSVMRLIISDETYNVKKLESRFSIVENLRQWLSLWQNEPIRNEIISLSKSISGLFKNASPDNAFDYLHCENVHQFLTEGIGLDFYDIKYSPEDDNHWRTIASEINIENFNFEKYISDKFGSVKLYDDSFFLKAWIENSGKGFEKWLLKNYYCAKNKGSYICQCFASDGDLYDEIATRIFLLPNGERFIKQRLDCLNILADKGQKLNAAAEAKIIEYLNGIAENESIETALKYFTSFTLAEKNLALEWLRDGKITLKQTEPFFPALVKYSAKTTDFDKGLGWLEKYFELYKQSKIQNRILPEMQDILNEKNKDINTFELWSINVRTVKTVLSQISGIDIYYWIDGLGVEWTEYIKDFFKNRENLHINKVEIARVQCPTVTSVNKKELEDVAKEKLTKKGSLDEHAHKPNKYPNYITEEFDIIDNALNNIVQECNGKKVAIVSDHGLSAMPQLSTGQNRAGYVSHHNGRYATKNGETICALGYESLCAKIPTGQSAHGGCTPEELLVPVFILSPEENIYKATLLNRQLTDVKPFAEFEIKGLSGTETVSVQYDGKEYNVEKISANHFRTENLLLTKDTKCITLKINGKKVDDYQVFAEIAAEEDDMGIF